MQENKELSEILRENFTLNKCRLDCLANIMMALMIARTVSLPRLAATIPSDTLYESCLKRLQRFFAKVPFDYDQLAKFLINILLPGNQLFQLSVDRTNWKLGKKNINILMLSVVFDGVAIPVMWSLLNKKGNSNTSERILLLKRFAQVFGYERIEVLLCDREFVGKRWFKYLRKHGITFVIRIKCNTLVQVSSGQKSTQIKNHFRCLSVNTYMTLNEPRRVWGMKLTLSALRLQTGELLILASNNHEIQEPIELYARRWEIETLFQCLKGRGFNFEDTHITDPERIKRLVATLALATVWALKVGHWAHENIKELKLNKYGRLEKSFFRYGLDFLHQVILETRYIHLWDTFLGLFSSREHISLKI